MFTIGITGGSGSGKTVLADKLVERFGPDRAVIVAQDSYYRDHSHLPIEKRQEGNFDEPKAVEISLLVEHLDRLRAGQPVQKPRYDFATHTRVGSEIVAPRDIVIVDGLFVLSDDDLRSRMDLKVFVAAPESERVRRRVRRDMQERGRTEAEIVERLNGTVLPMHAIHVEPCKVLADLVVDGCGDADAEAARVVAAIAARRGM
ncbi:MAG: uridine kinase [Planctomycetota bacterium]